MLKLKNVSKYYYQDGVVAKGLINVSLELHLGEFVVITGESGSGKSTLLNVLSGLDSYEDGEMYINGEETSHYTEEDYLKYRRSYVSNIFQNFNLVNSYTVYENIELALLMNGYNRKDIKNKVNELIEKVNLKKYTNTKTSKLSGGQKQRVAIARCLASDTPIIVADEPTGSLDSAASKSILKILHDIAKDKLVIVVTHNKSEILEYATRIIRMHDGRILENKVINDINLDKDVKSIEVRDISKRSKLRLGMRNAFNLPIKFILMFIIFLLISITLITNYGSFKIAEYEETSGYSNIFNNASDKRIVITKKDKEKFTNDDYNKIEEIANIDYIVKEDLLTDTYLYLSSDYLYLNGLIYLKNIDYVDIGRLPENDKEIVVIGSRGNYFFENNEIFDKEFLLENLKEKVKVVGILYDDSLNDYENKFYASEDLKNDLLLNEYLNYDDVTLKMTNITSNGFYLMPNDRVKKGEIYLSEMYCDECLNKEVSLTKENIFNSKEYKLIVKDTYNYENISNKLHVDYDYDEIIYLNEEDYENILKEDNYQSSVFVNDISNLSKVNKDLKKLGYETFTLRGNTLEDEALVKQIVKIIRLVVTIVLIFTLFFISYFIIRIIYKSRNSYYTTLRTLGSTKKVCIEILMNELITLATMTYLFLLIMIYLVKKNIINYEYLKEITKYVRVSDYLIVFLILIFISVLISYRYGRKIFKESIMKTYKDGV